MRPINSSDTLRIAPVPAANILLIDARGLYCPQPIVLLSRQMRAAPAQPFFILLSTDPGTQHDLLSWCRGWGHSVVAIRSCPPLAPASISGLSEVNCSAAEQAFDCYWIRRGET